MSVTDSNGSLRIDAWADRTNLIYVKNINEVGTTWPLSAYQCEITIIKQSTPIIDQGPLAFNKWATWALEKVEDVARENLVYGYTKFNQVCQTLRNSKEITPAQTLVRHHLFCQHLQISLIKKRYSHFSLR